MTSLRTAMRSLPHADQVNLDLYFEELLEIPLAHKMGRRISVRFKKQKRVGCYFSLSMASRTQTVVGRFLVVRRFDGLPLASVAL